MIDTSNLKIVGFDVVFTMTDGEHNIERSLEDVEGSMEAFVYKQVGAGLRLGFKITGIHFIPKYKEL